MVVIGLDELLSIEYVDILETVFSKSAVLCAVLERQYLIECSWIQVASDNAHLKFSTRTWRRAE